MRSLLLSRRDLDFLLYEWLHAEELVSSARFAEHSRETFDGYLDLCADLATRYFAPHNKLADANEPTFDGTRVTMIPEVKRAVQAFGQADLVGAAMDAAVGGMQLPAVVAAAGFAWFQAANVGTAAYPMLTVANANLIAAHGSPEQIEQFVRPMVAGRYTGTMCLSEPQAGSSLADIVTRAEPAGDGSYRVFGSKMWISGGEHELAENIIHLVLAKIAGGPPGVKGISLFIVPRVLPDGSRNDVALAGLNHKMGYRGTVNTVLQFGENGGAIGYLVGEAHQGLAYMFHMMNEARVGVGMGATALGYTGYLKSLDYARTRRQGRRLGGTEVVPLVAHPDVRRMLLAQKAYVEGALALELYCSALLDRERRDLLDILTPVAKSWPSQWCLEANSLAIQVHGGYGYTREYDVEQHYRDNRLNPIHEGTHGIQGLDLLGRKVARQHGLELVGAQIAKSVAAADASDLTRTLAGQLAAVWQQLTVTTAAMFGPGDIEAALANSSVYLEAFGHIVVAWMWLEQAVAAVGRDGDFYDGKRQAAQFFFAYELPKVGPQLDLLAALDRTTLDMRDDWF